MYGLAVNLIMSVSGHPSIINEISECVDILPWKINAAIFCYLSRPKSWLKNDFVFLEFC